MHVEYNARVLADLKNKHGNDLRGKFVRASKKQIESNITFRQIYLKAK